MENKNKKCCKWEKKKSKVLLSFEILWIFIYFKNIWSSNKWAKLFASNIMYVILIRLSSVVLLSSFSYHYFVAFVILQLIAFATDFTRMKNKYPHKYEPAAVPPTISLLFVTILIPETDNVINGMFIICRSTGRAWPFPWEKPTVNPLGLALIFVLWRKILFWLWVIERKIEDLIDHRLHTRTAPKGRACKNIEAKAWAVFLERHLKPFAQLFRHDRWNQIDAHLFLPEVFLQTKAKLRKGGL